MRQQIVVCCRVGYGNLLRSAVGFDNGIFVVAAVGAVAAQLLAQHVLVEGQLDAGREFTGVVLPRPKVGGRFTVGNAHIGAESKVADVGDLHLPAAGAVEGHLSAAAARSLGNLQQGFLHGSAGLEFQRVGAAHRAVVDREADRSIRAQRGFEVGTDAQGGCRPGPDWLRCGRSGR